jgi:alkylation response protein AidB-like acyl-CoA dehydrogenase
MDFRPSSSQQLLVATAREFLRKHCPPETALRLALDPRGFDETLWRQMAELGWLGLAVPEEHGGSGGSLLDVILLVEEMGRVALPGPFVSSAVVGTELVASGSEHGPHRGLLPRLAAGEAIVTLALDEDEREGDVGKASMTCDIPGRLSGTKLFVKDAHVATHFVVALRHGLLLLLPAERPGIRLHPLDTLSGEKAFEVTFDGVEVGPGDRLGPEVRGRPSLGAALEAGALARTAEMVGAAQRVLDLAVEHARTRVQGGRPIGGHQAIQHACADLVRDVDTSRGLLYTAAWKASEGRPASGDIATAKAYASEACLTVARRGHQIFGAIGYCEEHPLHLLHKRIQAASVDYGDPAFHLDTVAREIGLR